MCVRVYINKETRTFYGGTFVIFRPTSASTFTNSAVLYNVNYCCYCTGRHSNTQPLNTVRLVTHLRFVRQSHNVENRSVLSKVVGQSIVV